MENREEKVKNQRKPRFSLVTVGIEVLAVILRSRLRVRVVRDVGDGEASRPNVGLARGSVKPMSWTSNT